MALTFTLVDVNGVSHVLSPAATGIGVAVGASGLGMPALNISADKLPYAPGSRLRRVSTEPTQIEIPLFLEAATAAALEQILDDLHGWVLPGTEHNDEPSAVRFQVVATDGTSRELEGVCVGGLDDDDSLDAMGATWQDLVLTLQIPDPYWSDIADTIYTFVSGTGLRTWFPLYPYDLSPSSVFAEEVVTNSGQIETWPVWTITGPGSGLSVTNMTTEDSLTLSTVLGAGDVITIDTRPRHKTIVNQLGVNLFPDLSGDSNLWPLIVGANTLRVTMANTTVDSSVELAYRRRWARGRRR